MVVGAAAASERQSVIPPEDNGMTDALDYARPNLRRGGLLPVAVALSLVYPLLVVASLHGEWLYHCYVLGHAPRMVDPYVLPY